jgi:hypothetical protein
MRCRMCDTYGTREPARMVKHIQEHMDKKDYGWRQAIDVDTGKPKY